MRSESMRGLEVKINLSVCTAPYRRASPDFSEEQFVWILVKDGEMSLSVGTSSPGFAPAKPTLDELRYLITTLQEAEKLMVAQSIGNN